MLILCALRSLLQQRLMAQQQNMNTLSEAIADIKRNTANNSICPEMLTDPYWDPADIQNGPGALHPDAIPAAFRSFATARSNKGDGANTSSLPKPNNLSTGGRFDDQIRYHTCSYTVPERIDSPSISDTESDRFLRLTRKPARPEPDITKCLRYPWHDPFMGAPCPHGAGEQSKPFPFLTGRAVAEEPGLHKFQKIKELPSLHTRVKGIYPDEGGEMGYEWNMEEDSSTVFHADQYKIRDNDDLPSKVALARAANDVEADQLNLKVDPFGNAITDQTVRLTAIINHLSGKTILPLLDSWKPDENSGEPGLYVDFPKLANICSATRLSPPFRNLMSDVFACRAKYFIAWDMFFGIMRAIYDLEEERRLLLLESNEMNINPVTDGGIKRKRNIWRWRENYKKMEENVQRLRTCQDGLTVCARQLVEIKYRAQPSISRLFAEHEEWVESKRAKGWGEYGVRERE